MKKPYQIESQRAVKRLEEMATEGNPAVQMMLPMAEMVGWLRRGVGELVRQAGLQLMQLLMEEEVKQLAGERSRPTPGRAASRWGSERGYCVVMGQKVPVERPRVRSTEDREIRLGSYEMFHRGEPLTETVWEKLMLGLSTRKYGEAVREFTEAYGLEKSAVSEHFIEASRAKLQNLMERRLDKKKFCALLIDATPFEGQQMVAALGITVDGSKMILGIRQGATENATVVGELLSDLMNRGVDFTQPRLYVLDGGKALHAAVKKHAGDAAPIQRCQVHKRRNVLDHIGDGDRDAVARKLNAAYALEDHEAAKQALDGLHRELMHLNPSAARSLAEGLDETLTVHRLHVPQQLRMTLASTNVIESAFAIVERVCRNVKRWHGGDQRERWVGSGLIVAEKQFRRIRGYKQLPALLRVLETLKPSRKVVTTQRKAS
ncbi:MAG TPA: IS256 family transposase [Bryobacteraceae bacterium]|jgi:transposase-like protein|nr:IS256 family transposase [Bryobacteraceae bacterium]